MLTLPVFLHYADDCARSVARETLAAVVETESGFDPLSIHDNTAGRKIHPATLQEAIASATALISAGHSLDLGLGQLNSRVNLASRSVGIAEAFDPCINLKVSAQVLVEGYTTCRIGDAQGCVLKALSRYNTGDAARGFANGYVQRVQASAGQVVPAIRTDGQTAPSASSAAARPPAPAGWDVWAKADAAAGRPSEIADMPVVAPAQAAPPPQSAGRPGTPPVVMLQGLVAERTE